MDLRKTFPLFDSFDQGDPLNSEVVCAQAKVQGMNPLVTMRISRVKGLCTVEVDPGNQMQIGRFIVQSLVALLA
jgi:hypothetical protein